MDFSLSKIALIIFILAALAFTSGLEKEIKPPSEIQSRLEKLYPNAVAISWEMERNNYEAEFTSNGLDIEVTIDRNGNIIETEEEITIDDVPAQIKSGLDSINSTYRITKIARLTREEKKQYHLIALLPGSRDHFLFDSNGKILSRKTLAKDKPVRTYDAASVTAPVTGTKWELPVILTEVSGIALLKDDIMACIQDETGSIFLYDLRKKIITEEIPFAGPGDYEGVSIVNNDAYVLRSDGLIYEIMDFRSASRKITEHKLKLAKEFQNFEGLCLDPKSNRLLLAPRTFDTDNTNHKNVYAFDLTTKKFSLSPVFSIDLNHTVFNSLIKSGKNDPLIPSEIAIHPVTGDVYISDARNRQILITDMNGKIKSLHPLNRSSFPKTEGLAITSDGHIYLSNEGKKSRPNILKLSEDKLK